eukprot:3775332-Karenia_brevis.AAC.1
MQFLEEKGAVAPENQFGSMAALKNSVDSMTTELERYSSYTKKSPPLLRSMLAAMEHFVVDTSQPRFLRAYAWLKLVRVWAALRADDVQGLLPETVKIFERGVQAALDRTKTSGPGKKIRWMRIYI